MSEALKVHLVNDDKFAAFIKKIPAGAIPAALKAMTDFATAGNSFMRWYPPKRPESTYIRTFNLKNSWYGGGGGNKAYIATQVPYAIYPMGDPPASKMRALGWVGALERVLRNMTYLVGAAKKAVRAWIAANQP